LEVQIYHPHNCIVLALGGCAAMETGDAMNTKGVPATVFHARLAETPEQLVDRRGGCRARDEGVTESDDYGDRCPVSDKI